MRLNGRNALLLIIAQALQTSLATPNARAPTRPQIHRRAGDADLNGTITSASTPVSPSQAPGSNGSPITVPVTFSGTAYIEVFLVPTIAYDWTYLTVEGPTTVITEIPNLAQATPRTQANGDVITGPPWQVFTTDPALTTSAATLIVTAPWIGTQTWGIADDTTYKNVTGVAPTTIVTNVTIRGYATNYINPVTAYHSAGGRCHGKGEQFSHIDKTVELRTSTELSAGQTITFDACNSAECAQTYAGPTSVQLTTTQNYFIGGLAVFETPDMTCENICAACYLLYPEVNVHYWPFEGADLSCLPNNGSVSVVSGSPSMSGLPASNSSSPPVTMRPLAKRDGTTVVSGDFTFTSPSIYIEFPTLSAADNCGALGPSFVNYMRSYDPSALSTAVYSSDFNSAYQPFDFRYADCPPQSVLNGDYWFAVANKGAVYNPIISQPPGLTDVHPYWASCFDAPFQGRDPPVPLTSQTGLLPNPTPPRPVHTQNPEPGQNVGGSGPPTSTVFQPSSVSLMPAKESKSSGPTTEDSPKALSNEDPKPTASADPPPPQSAAESAINPGNGGDPNDPNSPSNQNDPGSQNKPSSPTAAPVQSDPSDPGSPTIRPAQSDPGTPDPHSNNPHSSDVPQGQKTPPAGDPGSLAPDSTQGSGPSKPSNINNDHTPSADPDPQAFTFHSEVHTPDSSGNFIISSTLHPAGAPITLDGTPVTLPSIPESTPTARQGQETDGQDPAAQTAGDRASPPVQVISGANGETETVSANSAGHFVVSGTTHNPGDVFALSGHAFTLPSAVPSAAAGGSNGGVKEAGGLPAVATINGQPLTADRSGDFVASGSTFRAGETAIVDNTPITFPAAPTTAPRPAVITAAGHTLTADTAGDFTLDGSTFHAGETATIDNTPVTFSAAPADIAETAVITAAGQTLTADPAGDFTLDVSTFHAGETATIDGTPVTFPVASTKGPKPAAITAAGQTLTADPAGDFIFDGSTFYPEETATIEGTPVTFPTAPMPGSTHQQVLTLADGKTYTADASGDFAIGGQTLKPGGVVTADGQTVSLGGTALTGSTPIVGLVNGKTETLGGATQTGDIGDSVASGIGGVATGGARRRWGGGPGRLWFVVVGGLWSVLMVVV